MKAAAAIQSGQFATHSAATATATARASVRRAHFLVSLSEGCLGQRATSVRISRNIGTRFALIHSVGCKRADMNRKRWCQRWSTRRRSVGGGIAVKAGMARIQWCRLTSLPPSILPSACPSLALSLAGPGSFDFDTVGQTDLAVFPVHSLFV